jgi:hypothetical protein
VYPRDVAQQIANITSGWKPGPGANAESLAAAQAALAASLTAGMTTGEIATVNTDLTAHALDAEFLSEIEQLLSRQAATTTAALAYARSALAADVRNPTGVPAWARGMQVQQVHGPFLDSHGISHFVDVVFFTVSVKFAFGNAANVFAVLPVSISFVPGPPNQIRLGAGSVWFEARVLVPGLAAANVAGFRIRHGTLKLSVPAQIQNGIHVLPANATATLTASLDIPVAPPAAGATGADAAASDIALPKTVSIAFRQNTATVEALDSSRAQLYGSSVNLTWNHQAPSAIDGNTWLLIPCASNAPTFTFATVKSTLFIPSGTAPIAAAGWVLPIAAVPIASVGEAAGAGALLLGLGAGASLTCEARPTSAAIGAWQLLLSPGTIFVLLSSGGPLLTVSYELWPEQPPSTRNSSVAFTTGNNFLMSWLATPGLEILSALGLAAAHLDRPLAADGSRFPMSGLALLQIGLSSAGKSVFVLALEIPALEKQVALALTNALVGVNGPTLFAIFGGVTGTSFLSANVVVFFNARWLLPTLPDPYAASFGLETLRERNQLGTLAVLLTWNGLTTVDFTFSILQATSPLFGVSAMVASGAGSDAASTFSLAANPSLGTRALGLLALLDLSTHVDQFGVAIAPNFQRDQPNDANPAAARAPALGFDGLSLAVNGGLVLTFALPQVSWEPMESAQFPAGPIYSTPPSDGVPTLVQAADFQKLVPFAPAPVLSSNIANVVAGKSFSALFSLPFGLIARIQQPNRPRVGKLRQALFLAQGGAFHLTRPRFPSQLEGAVQLTLKPPHPENPMAKFEGQTLVDTHGPAPGYGRIVLAPSVADIFDSEFGTGGGNPPSNAGVPVRRIDLAGYGASIFSEWADDVTPPPKVTKVHFETVVGRTAHEVVQVETVLYPYGPKLVRTVTIQRQNTGWVQRTDTGWQPASHGIFKFPPPNTWANRVHRGAVGGVFNLRNIREQPDIVTCPPVGGVTFEFRKVLFDADIGLDHRIAVVAGGKASALVDADNQAVTLVPSRDLVGYVQLKPAQQTPSPEVLVELFKLTGPVQPALSCVVQVGAHGGKPGTGLRCAAIEVGMATKTAGGNPAPALGAALRGAPALPRDGHWSVGQRGRTAPAPSPLPGDFPVPLVQALSDAKNWHLADIGDVLQLANPDTRYGLLQDTGTQKILFEQPTIPQLDASSPPGSVPGIQLPQPPNFADVASLLNATGLFPDIGNTISLITGGVEQLNTFKDGLQYSKAFTFDKTKPPLTLLDLGVIRVALSYCDESKGRPGGVANAPTVLKFDLDPTAVTPAHRWSFSVAPLSFLVTVPEFSNTPLLMVIGGFVADDQTKATLSGLHLVYGDALATLTNVLNKLQALAQFLPGGKGAGLHVGLSDGRLTVSDTFAIPSLPLGLGEITDVCLELGLTLTLAPVSADFSIGIGSANHPFNWIVSPLAGNGLIVVGVKGGKPELTVQAGIGLGLAINVAIASGSASVTIAVQLDVTGKTITLMAILTGRASVDVLGGLVGATLTLSAGIGFSLNPFPPLPQLLPPLPSVPTSVDFPSCDITLLASVSVGIHISICWVVSVDWDGSWQFSQTVHTPHLALSL